jgi:hypothetical protein
MSWRKDFQHLTDFPKFFAEWHLESEFFDVRIRESIHLIHVYNVRSPRCHEWNFV